MVTNEASGAKIALFRCTQMVLWQNPDRMTHRFFFAFFFYPSQLAEGAG